MAAISDRQLDERHFAVMRGHVERARRYRLAILPLLLSFGVLALVGDRAAWRWWVLATAALGVLIINVVHHVLRWADPPIPSRSPLLLVTVPLAMGGLALATGGFDSPLLMLLVPTCFAFSIFAEDRALLATPLLLGAVAVGLAVVSARHLIPDLMPAAFGGGAGVPQPVALVAAKAVALVFCLGWMAVAARLLRRTFREVLDEMLAARDEILAGHEAQARELTTLSGELAHELKNPLANVRGLAALVGREVHGRAAERIALLQHEVDRMNEILQHFLSLSRPLGPLSREEVDLQELGTQALALHEGLAQERRVRLALAGGGPLAAWCDPRKVKQILINLIQNALEASAAGGTVELAVERRGDAAEIAVRDHGPGLSPAARAHLFQPGWTTRPTGSGIGLALCRTLARQHGGELTLDDAAGGGCRATLRLPLGPEAAAGAAPTGPTPIATDRGVDAEPRP